MAIDTEIYKKPKMNTFIFSIIFFIIILLLTLGLYLYNSKVEKDIKGINEEINTINISVNSIKSKIPFQVHELIMLNKGKINNLFKYSDIPAYVSHIKEIAIKYNIDLYGFDYSNQKIGVNAISTSTQDKGLAYKKIVKFIEEYRGETSTGNLFNIGFINNFSGNDKIRFQLKLEIK